MWLKKIHETGQGGKYKGCEILLNIYIRFRENVMKIYEMAFRKTRGGGAVKVKNILIETMTVQSKYSK